MSLKEHSEEMFFTSTAATGSSGTGVKKGLLLSGGKLRTKDEDALVAQCAEGHTIAKDLT
jgi:hypothetical protein